MKRINRLIVPAAVVLFFAVPTLAAAKDVVLKEPPPSLAKLYPPESAEPKWIQQMHKMSGHFGGIFIDMGEKDFENVDKHADGLAEAYEETSKLVPEWKDYFDVKAAKDFAAAARTHDMEAIKKASGALGKTCGKCHDENQVAVWTRFHWPAVGKIKITDPVDEKELDFGKYMKLLSNSFKAANVNFGEGQYDRALKGLDGFRKRYMELKSTCAKCHTMPEVKLFFVGEGVEKAMDGMKAELMAEKPNPGKYFKNVGIVGQQGCKMCHLTHRSYAIIQEIWEEKEEAKK
ncbi:MAG: hypothetical protein COV67_06180 [Nitrospinae bacterium CG11_big_fil_rev_8_21_14_0_20_56_8]|nr:MAG: hypothetical protein COV67_06180 [Nitrospinae bacterium CG11_big_fil_rev_8_21_14_0_20_56_8]